MLLERTLTCGAQIWKPRKVMSQDTKFVKWETQEQTMPIRSETIRLETTFLMNYMATTDMMSVKVIETNMPKDVVSLIYGEAYFYFVDKTTGVLEKVRFTWREPKVIVVPLNSCDYGILSMKTPTCLTIKKNYKRMIITRSKLPS